MTMALRGTLIFLPARWVAVIAVFTGACTGSVDDRSQAMPGGGQGGTTSGSSGGAGASGVPSGNAQGDGASGAVGAGTDAGPAVPPGSETTPSLGPTSARRLTREEYLNTVGDLLGQSMATLAAAVVDDQAPDGTLRNDIAGRVVSDQYVTGYENVATAIASAMAWTTLSTFSPCATATVACQNGLISQLGRLLYRRPLTDAEVANLSTLYAATTTDAQPFQAGSRLVLEAMLQSPHFLYQLEQQEATPPAPPKEPSAFELATRLSMLIWKSGPDASLLDAATKGSLNSPNAVAAKVTEMLADPRARRGVREFADDWLGVYANPERTPDSTIGLTASVLVDMRQETLRFVERLAFDDKVDLMQMFLDKKTELTPELAKLYGLNPTSAATALYDLSTNPNRIGLLTQPAVLGVRAGPASASLVQRGLTIMKNILCESVGAPPDNATVHLQSVDPTLPERSRFAIHEQFGASCATCHTVIDPFGYPFVAYDLAGRFISKDQNGNLLQTDGQLSLDGASEPYRDAAGFAAILAKSPSVERCLVSKYVEYALGRAPTAGDDSFVDHSLPSFRQQGRTYAQLVGLVTTSTMFRSPAPEMFK